MSEKIKHTPGPYYVASDEALDCPPHKNSGLALVDTGRAEDWPIARLCEWGNARLIAIADSAPHDCDDPQCPGVINKRRLEALGETRRFLTAVLREHGFCYMTDRLRAERMLGLLDLLEREPQRETTLSFGR